MTLTNYLRILRRQWSLVILVVGVVGLITAAYTLSQAPTYSANAKMFVSARTSDSDITDLTQGNTFTQERVKSYANLLTSAPVLEHVIGNLGLTYTPGQLADHVTAVNPPDSVLLEVTVRDGNAQQAADIANAIVGYFPSVVDRIETPVSGSDSPVKISVTNPAVASQTPVSPHVKLNLGLGLLIGLGLGLALAIYREQSNTTIRHADDVLALTGSMPLGEVPYDPGAARHPLIDTPEAAERAEAFRALRTGLQFVDVDSPPRVIVVSSALPGEGKTSTACNLALTISLSGSRVVLVDGDLRKPSVGPYLGISNAVGLTNLLAGRHELRDVMVQYRHEGLHVLPSGPRPPNPAEVLGSQQMIDLLTRLADEFDIVIVDAPPLLPVTDAAVLAAQADGTIFVVRHGTSRREETVRAKQVLAAVHARILGTVLNRTPLPRRSGSGQPTLAEAPQRPAAPVGGWPGARPGQEAPRRPRAGAGLARPESDKPSRRVR